MLSREDLAQLRRQERLSWALSLPTYAFLILVGRLYFRYKFRGLPELRRRVWAALDAEPGPVIWAANHLTLIDSFLVFWAVFPWRRAALSSRVPWSTPEYRNYYHLGSPWRKQAIRALMYLCRCIPFLREGDDEAAVRWRETAFEKLIAVLKGGGAVFVYPEAGRSRAGWFERHRPKDFLGRLALEVPRARFLCVYLRGEGQVGTTVYPAIGETFRVEAELVPAVLPGETTPRAVSARLFSVLSELQERWFAASALVKNCGGNDVVDLAAPLHREHIDAETGEADEDWLARHLTEREREQWAQLPARERFAGFWRYFAAKEAAHKALARAGLGVPSGGFRLLEVDLFRRKAVHRPTGAQLDIAFTDDDGQKLHCLAVLRGGYIGDDSNPGDLLWRVREVPPGRAPGEFVRELCLELIAESSEEPLSPASLALSEQDGAPVVLKGGKARDWGVSLSHSGRFAACSFMAS